MTCEVPACGRSVHTAGRCGLHYARKRLGIADDQPVQHQASRDTIERLTPRVVQLWEAGTRQRDIAAEVGLSHTTVEKIIKKAGAKKGIPHGTPSAWQYHRCRCEVCLEARTEYKRSERLRRLARAKITADHGTVLAYRQGCRCEPCMTAVAEESRARNEASRPGAHRHGRRWTSVDAHTAYRTDLTIAERAELLGRTFAAVDDWIRTYDRRPDDPYQVKPRSN